MIDALHISESGLKATQAWIDHISNNVANMQTPGYKKSTVQFENMVNQNSSNESSSAPNARENSAGMGARLTAPSIDFSEGSYKATYRSLDVAIRGNGFFEVIQDSGEPAYTRIGSLRTNNEGMLTTIDGLELSDQIQVPPDVGSLTISNSGVVEATFLDDASKIELGQIRLAHIANPDSLNALSGGLYTTTQASGTAVIRNAGEEGMGEVTQGYIEMSNVELVDEMTNLVLAQRAYQLNARIIQTADQVLETINNLRR